MEFLKNFFNAIFGVFKSFAKKLEENAAIAKIAMTTGLHFFLETNPQYAPEVKRAMVGMKEYLTEKNIATNSELMGALEEQMKGLDLPPYLLTDLLLLITTALDKVDKGIWNQMSGEDVVKFWIEIMDEGIKTCDWHIEKNKGE